MSESIDSHVHLWTRSTDPQEWVDPATMPQLDRDFEPHDLVTALDATRREQAVVVQSTNSASETLRLLRGAGGHPRVRGVVGWLDLTIDLPRQLACLSDGERGRLVGVRHLAHVDPDERWLIRDDVATGLRQLGRADLGFDLVVRPWQLPLVRELAARDGMPRLVLDHLGGAADADDLWEWERDMRALAVFPSVTVKLSGQAPGTADDLAAPADRLERVADIALDAFGADRLMYGSDWPLSELRGGIGSWAAAADGLITELSTDERDAVLGGTAAQHYRHGGIR